MIEVKLLNYHPILKDISFSLQAGELMGIIGPNGSGKTTLVNIIANLIVPSSGNIIIDNIPILKNHRYPHEKISLVPQLYQGNPLFPLSVKRLIQLPFKIREFKNKTLPFDEDFFVQLVERTGISPFLEKNIHQLSVGERQRCLLVMALIKKPKVLLLDEPLSGLDGAGVDQILEVLHWEKVKKQMAIIVIDHQIGHLIKNADKLLCINHTGHWHDHKDQLTKEILQNYYHCEFEHLLMHSQGKEGKECPTSGNH